jgi:hypothetical protein
MFETFTMNMLGFIGWFLMIPVTHQMMKMADSMNKYSVKETCDVYLLCDRVVVLEKDIVKLTQTIKGIKEDDEEDTTLFKLRQTIEKIKENVDNELHKDYVDTVKYNREKQIIKDDIKILYRYLNKI